MTYTKYNNYKIFQSSSNHFFSDQKLYVGHPAEHYDLYKYTPTFSVLFAIIAWTPDVIGLSIWNLLNVLVLVFGIYSLPRLTKIEKSLIVVLIFTQLMVNLQNEQSNSLITGLILIAYSLMERKKMFLAILCLGLTVFIKLFGIVAFVLILLYPNRGKSILYSTALILIMGLIPGFFVGFQDYFNILKDYGVLLANDHSVSFGFSGMGILNAWFAVEPSKILMVLFGAILFLLPLLQLKKFEIQNFRLGILCSLLIWLILFNHKSESPTLIIGTTGFILWYVANKKNLYLNILFGISFVFICLSPTDIIPQNIRFDYIQPLLLNIFCMLVFWLVLQAQLWKKKA